MSDYQTEVRRLVEGFVSELSDLWRRAVADSLSGLNHNAGTAAGVAKATRGRAAGHAHPAAARRKGEKRTGVELDRLADSFYEFVVKHPGLRIEQINRELGTTTKDLALPIRKLIADGMLKGKGEKRSRTYTASEAKRKKSN